MLSRQMINDDYCEGVSLSIVDQEALARAVALVLVQEFLLARRLLGGEPTVEVEALEPEFIDEIVERRLKCIDRYHRDGYLFQLMMWLAAHLDSAPGDLVALPQSQPAAKGQDGIIVHRSADAVVALSICEDKATDNPRATVRKEVLPAIRDYEAGGRKDELRSAVITALGAVGNVPLDEAQELVRRISWSEARRYRLRIALGSRRTPTLFRGFEREAPGPESRRSGQTVLIPDLRNALERFALQVEQALLQMKREQ